MSESDNTPEPAIPPHIYVQAISTPMLCEVNGVPTRIFLGKTEAGTECMLYVVSLSPMEETDREKFTAECEAGGLRGKPRKTLTYVHVDGPTWTIEGDEGDHG